MRPALAVPLTRPRKHRTDLVTGRGDALRIHERASDVVGRLRAREPPHDLEIRAEELVKDPVFRRRVAARVPPEPVAAFGDHQRLPDALGHVSEGAPLLLCESAGALERAPRPRGGGVAAPPPPTRLRPRPRVEPGARAPGRRLLE